MSAAPASLSLTVPGDPALDAVLEGDGAFLTCAVVASPHPLMGGEMRNPVVQALARGCRAAALRTLTFDYRGVGDSYGSPSGDFEDAVTDYRAAVLAGSKVTTLVVASGYSFGAAAAIRVAAADPRFTRVLAVAPPAPLIDPEDVARLGQRLTLVAAERDTIALASELERLTVAGGARFELVPAADHFFGSRLARIAELAEHVGRAL